jgi:hypothetical protein
MFFGHKNRKIVTILKIWSQICIPLKVLQFFVTSRFDLPDSLEISAKTEKQALTGQRMTIVSGWLDL